MRGLINWFIGVVMGGAIGAVTTYLVRDGLPKDTREKLKNEFDNAVDAGRDASAARKIELEKRLVELLGPEQP